MLVKLVDFIKSITLKDLIFVGIIVILFGCLCFSMNKCSTVNDRYENNIKALTDTISYYESKTGSLIATKTAYESDIKELKLVNDDLYQEIADMKIKLKNISSAANIKGEIIYEPGDTVYIVKSDTIYKGFENESFLTGVVKNICIPIVAIIIFLIWGFSLNAWYIAWIVFLAVPVWIITIIFFNI